MSEPSVEGGAGKPAPQSYGVPEQANWRLWARWAIWVILAVIAILFIVRNSSSVEVNFLFHTFLVPMYVALIFALVLGILIGAGGLWMIGRRRAKRKAAPPAKK
ncbi:MAG: DUF1049 domain-containing protein [Actinobacteria bacterium]|nr:DUF1049 domain-containing protein [Actinomycetota bacterium]